MVITAGITQLISYSNHVLLPFSFLPIQDVIVKTLIVAQPHIQHSYQACRPSMGTHNKCQCFEILGFDILVDENVRPWLIEVRMDR